MIRIFKPLANDSVVINFAVDSKRDAFILVGEWLRSTVNTDNAKTFVCQN